VSVEDQVIEGDLAERILHEVAGMSALDRDIFRLCATEGYAYRAAAEQLGVAHGVVRNRLSRIRTRLRTVVKEST
jgi:RNA polymerase sigma-70 factor (ECF subfamily)